MASTVRDNPDRRRYEVVVDDQVAGFSDYRRDDARITFVHTEVADAYAGQRLGRQLVVGLLDDADERGLQVVPLCPFVRQVLAERPEYLHLVPDDVRGRLGLPHLDA
jgi:uncharacterized protein